MQGVDAESSPAAADLGYEVHIQGPKVILVNRRLWALGYAIVILAAILAVVIAAGVSMAKDPEITGDPRLGILLLGAPVAVPIPGLGFAWFRRRRRRLDRMSNLLVLDRDAGVLRDSRGLHLANLEDVRVKHGLDLMTRGMSRRVLLRWPGGRRVVFRTLRPARAQEVHEVLAEMCGGSSMS